MLLLVAACCRPAPTPPTLEQALKVGGSAADKAKSFCRVAIEGIPGERRRAALLWGLFACEARSPLSALHAFAVAMPTEGRAVLARRRLEESLRSGPPRPELWLQAAAASWLPAEDCRSMRLRAAELAGAGGDHEEALSCLPALDELRGDERARALAVIARSQTARSPEARRLLAMESPHRYTTYLAGESLETITATFGRHEWAKHAQGWLGAGRARAALTAARRAGDQAALTAARAALRLRRSREALRWAERAGRRDAEALLEAAEARRQIAWQGSPERRRDGFQRMLEAARQVTALAAPGSHAARRAELLIAEALVELERFTEAGSHLVNGWDATFARCEWVWRRLVFLSSKAGKPVPLGTLAELPGSTRQRRLAAYWHGVAALERGDAGDLARLADSGFPDLPGIWAALRLGRAGVPVVLGEGERGAPSPPPWARDLLALGRVSDVAVAWRAELVRARQRGPAWLGLAALTNPPPLEVIPLLVRGEPSLLRGPWGGLSRPLLESYLPLLWRGELEAAAQRAGVPPWVLAGLVRQESAWRAGVVSAAGAIGLTQILPATGREVARSLRIAYRSSSSLRDPETNLTLGAALLARWRARYRGSWVVGLACYNAGERRIQSTWERYGRTDGPEFVEGLELPETWDYVHRVVLLSEGYRLLYWPAGRSFPWT